MQAGSHHAAHLAVDGHQASRILHPRHQPLGGVRAIRAAVDLEEAIGGGHARHTLPPLWCRAHLHVHGQEHGNKPTSYLNSKRLAEHSSQAGT